MTSGAPSVAFDATYYQSANYTDYLERRDRYLRTAAEIVELLIKLCLLTPGDTICDYGCGPGFLVEGFKAQGHVAYGAEVSEWAMAQAAARDIPVHHGPIAADIMTALDVFEHMTDAQITEAIRTVNPRVLVARIPCSTDGGKTFHLAVSRRDPTHVNCRTKNQWIAFLGTLGYAAVLRINGYSFYDSDGVACLLAVKS
jgi:2-polyprenyl-3-methyl-5-hydroxy-6-metoxy-1,4-benzoquinol methylase